MTARVRLGLVAAALALGGALPAVIPMRAGATSLPQIKHVWVVMLENESNSTAFAGSTYLATTLKSQGAYIPGYYGIGHESLDNYIALISGQSPNPDTQGDCQVYQDVSPGGLGQFGQEQASSGCVYKSATTVADQLTAAGKTWKGYMEDLEQDKSRDDPVTCNPPTAPTQDPTQSAEAKDQYAVRHDPFMYFHSVIDNTASCKAHVVQLQDPAHGLTNDLRAVETTPNYSFVVPNLCDDGHDPSMTSVNTSSPGSASTCAAPDASNKNNVSLAAIDDWLGKYIPPIVASPAFQQDGMLVITFDESTANDVSYCCNEDRAANGNSQEPGIEPGAPSASPASTGYSGGGQVGAVVLSPFIHPGTTSQRKYNHYSLLRTTEDLLHLSGGSDGHGHLGFAMDGNAQSYPGPCDQPSASDPCQPDFGSDVFTDPTGTSHPNVVPGGLPAPSLHLGSGSNYLGALPGVAALPSGLLPAEGSSLSQANSDQPSSTPDFVLGDNDVPNPVHSLKGPVLAAAESSPLGLLILIIFAPLGAVAGALVLLRRRGGGG